MNIKYVILMVINQNLTHQHNCDHGHRNLLKEICVQFDTSLFKIEIDFLLLSSILLPGYK